MTTELERRLDRIERALGLTEDYAHHRPILCVPADVPDVEAWVAAQPCACGVCGCPEQTFGLVIPAPVEAEAWAAAARHFYATRPPLDAR
jgi:hypothetical protein